MDVVSNSTTNDLSCGSGESLVDITLSILKMLLLCFIILDLTPPNYSDPTFYLGMNAIPKVSSYIYLGIPFSDDLLLEHIISHMHFKVRKSLLSLTHFFSNKLIPIAYKKKSSSILCY
jgi:hypothetical protein